MITAEQTKLRPILTKESCSLFSKMVQLDNKSSCPFFKKRTNFVFDQENLIWKFDTSLEGFTELTVMKGRSTNIYQIFKKRAN